MICEDNGGYILQMFQYKLIWTIIFFPLVFLKHAECLNNLMNIFNYLGAGKPTKTGQTVLELQNALPKARVVYASATGASEPKHMAYMVRLGIWGPGSPFRDFNDFLGAVEKRGVGAMEIVAMDMKLRGMYIARQLSFQVWNIKG